MIKLIGRNTINFLTKLGAVSSFLWKVIKGIFTRPFATKSLFDQIVKIGWDSIPVTFFTAISTGGILALQSGYTLMTNMRGSEQFVGGIVALSIVTELGPILCAIMVAGRAGSGITAEISTMNVTEQLDALTTLSTNPINYLVVPRVLAGMIVLPLLTIFTDIVAIIGGLLVATLELGLNKAQYISTTLQFLNMEFINTGLIKSVFFGLIITLLSSFEGFRSEGGAEGVGKSTTKSVVFICMTILFADYFLTSILSTGSM